ncbi:glycosyltransferase 36 [Thalassoporum mexicanum PCC 7367]|uniref:GH36-type glycosyl hydrolase domain-containing protein n=1 Tax=Thalassoporum mexicanum TaxID=3457544 RepID=UPI00029FEBE7|nr:glycosyl transferase [Pseudanabaena sp. PCC 7367]AFY70316.1 glycosyltransferase 36 [Pseudanabaena sp. PCC 7367]
MFSTELDSELGNKYGYFSQDGREFIITDPRTPRPWFNYIWNGRYAGLISHTGGGFSFLDSPRDNRLTRMRYNCLPWDRPGRYVLVKDVASGEYWSLSWAPTIDRPYDLYECHHGQGYTRIITEINQIRGEITYFVPTDNDAEVWRVRLTNLSDRPRQLEIYSFTELLMGNALNDLINQPNDKHFTDIHFDQTKQALIATRRYWVLNKKVSVAQPNIDWQYRLYFTQTLPVKGFDGSLDTFIGRWRSEANPESVETGVMHNTEITAGDPIVALQSELELAAGNTKDFAVILGVTPKSEPIEPLNDLGLIDQKFTQLTDRWDQYLSQVQIDTPDPKFNLMLNVWNQYQAAVTFDMARNAGYYHGGLLFGTGMRDQFQDILGVVMVEPQRVRSRLLNALQYQFADGSTLHNFFKLTGTGEKTNHSDTPLWVPFGIVEYLKETGDFSILAETVPYHDAGAGTVYEHLIMALDYVASQLSDRGMPKIMNGDWNDTLDHIGTQGKGETIWGAFFWGYILKISLELIEAQGDRENLNRFQTIYQKLGQTVNELCWDGDWYVRAFRDNGAVIGSDDHQQGKIFLNAQSWAVISGLAPKERADRALAACHKYLAKPNGMQIVYPAYRQIDDSIGLISRCVPGKKENGAIFNHASSWFVLAALLNDQVELGWEIYQRMMPLNSAQNIDRYEVEPYVYAEYLTSPEHPTDGQASHSWLTGTAVWMLRVGIGHIIGFRTGLDGIYIDPHVPADWPGFRARRSFRGKVLDLTVHNPKHKNSGVKTMLINGQLIEGNFIDPGDYAESQLAIEVELG